MEKSCHFPRRVGSHTGCVVIWTLSCCRLSELQGQNVEPCLQRLWTASGRSQTALGRIFRPGNWNKQVLWSWVPGEQGKTTEQGTTNDSCTALKQPNGRFLSTSSFFDGWPRTPQMAARQQSNRPLSFLDDCGIRTLNKNVHGVKYTRSQT